MKISIELKALALGATTSLVAVGLAFAAGVMLQKINQPNQGEGPAVMRAGVSSNRHFENPPNSALAQSGRTLFAKNCAHCHGDDARGDEGPDLHGLKRSDDWIARRIRNGVKGEMTAFGEKFSQQDIDALTAYLRTLK